MTAVTAALRWTSADLEGFPEPLDDTRYEIIDGELYVSTQPTIQHQQTCSNVVLVLGSWSRETGAGITPFAPGVIFAEDDNVAPDVVWVSAARLAAALGSDGKLHGAPDLVVEVLSPGATNERRDRDAKLKLYSRQGVLEYWIVDWQQRQVALYRREQAALRLTATLYERDVLESPLLPGFGCQFDQLFTGLPSA